VSDGGDTGQWQMIRTAFARHRLAAWSGSVLAVMYLLAAMAEFVAPYPPGRMDLGHAYCPPQLPRVGFDRGIYTYPMRQQVDPVTLRRTYYEDRSSPTRLALFAAGDRYELWGVVPMSRRLIGVARGSEDADRTFYPLGADRYGRDVLSRIIFGARVSLSVGLVGVAITFILGTVIGGVSGYIGGRVDNLIQRGIEVVNAFPQLPLWMAVGAVLPGDWSPLRVYFAVTLVLSLLGWTGLARVVRGKILSLREEDYAVAARLLGAGHARVLFRHLVPGFTSHIIVALTLSIPGMILGETSLSFLGLGLRPPVVSWGVMLQDCMDVQAVRYYPWLLAPVAFIVTTVLCFNFVGDGLRDAADPYSSR
jgi:peptide/nickel transport system permease protein